MPNSCTTFGQRHDSLGQSFNFAFRGSTTFGTAVGGYISIAVAIFIWIVALAEIYFCLSRPFVTQYSTWNQLEVPNEIDYKIEAIEGFPSF